MCIATILGNPPSDEARKRGQGTTLIVCPASAVSQWQLELKKHTKPKLDVLVYRGSMDIDTDVLQKVSVL
jgi:SNF2 family DNA or RNA helicase